MTFRLQQEAGEWCVLFTEEDVRALGLKDGDPVTLIPGIDEGTGQNFEYVSTAEALMAFEETYAKHESSYLELAK